MKLFEAYYLLISLSLRVASQELSNYAKPGCNDTCGKVRIPYPFGIGENCSLNEWYAVQCIELDTLTPYIQYHPRTSLDVRSVIYFYLFQIVEVSLENQTITVNTNKPRFSDCQNPVTQTNIVNLSVSPFLLSAPDNIFVFEGCGNAKLMDTNGSTVVSNCSTTCQKSEKKNNCSFGINCCQTRIHRYLQSYDISLTQKPDKKRSCGSAFVMDTRLYNNQNFNKDNQGERFAPISLLWTLSEDDYKNVNCSCGLGRAKLRVPVGHGTSVDSWRCRAYSSFSGNPYLEDGCQETSVTQYTNQACSKRCKGICYDDNTIYNINGSVYEDRHYCYEPKSEHLIKVVLGVSISIGVLFLMAISYALYKLIKKTKEKRQRKRYFKRNGGILLKQQAEADPSLVDKTILFTSRELAKATDDFSENRVLGRGGQGTVYKGMLVDGRIVAIKKSKVVDESQLEQFINEVVILSQVNHRNVVKLLGCCLETDVPLLVSEFISNGTLFDHLHNDTDEFPLSLNMRLQIATEVAGAVAYLHSATSIPIYHRDIKTTNILLDDKYRAKVSDFGTSRLVSVDQTHLTTMVKGTFGYLDPEYFQSSQFTEKSDVYSFGVVLVELITGEKPISLTRFGEHRSLATYFTVAMEEGRGTSIFDEKMIKEATRDELLLIANLAMRCLNMNGKNRPTMKEVVVKLETIQTSHIPSTVPTNTSPKIYEEELSEQPYGESTSTFMTHGEELSEQPYGESTSTFMSIDDSICHIGR